MIDHVVQEPLPDDRVAIRWTELGTRADDAELCEVVFSLDELAAMERGEVVFDPAPITRQPLDEAIAETQARLKDLEEWRDAAVHTWPELKSQGRRK